MGRVSHREQIAEINEHGFITKKTAAVIYNTAIYARLSVEDTRDGKCSDTLNTQVYFLEKYLEDKPYLCHKGTYTDNGFSGTSFQRPGFEEMMNAVKNGEINCIVVKDLSRLGRNYMETGRYVEYLFPFMKVRFISVNDGYDSINPMDNNTRLSVSIKNLVNDRFAHDISKKINATFQTKWKNGEFLGAFAPHGYMKSPEDRHKLIIDEETAPVIRRIFEMRADGKTYGEIADTLNIERIESPAEYKIRCGVMKRKNDKPGIWIYTQIRKILLDSVYIGHMAQGKTSQSKFQGKKYIYNDPSKWYIAENTHEAVISKDLWEKVQNKFKETKAAYEENHGKFQNKYSYSENILKGKIFCDDCGYSIGRAPKYYADGSRYFQYACNHKNIDGKCCPSKLMLEPKLFDLIYRAVRLQMNLCTDYKQIIQGLEKQPAYKSYTDALDEELKKLVEAKRKAINRKASLYDDYAGKSISKSDYIMLSGKYDEDITALSVRISETEACISHRSVLVSDKNDWITAFDKFRKQRKLSKEMVELLIGRITVVSKDRVEIQFNFRDEFAALAEGIEKFNKGADTDE